MFYLVELLRTYSRHLGTVSDTFRHLERRLTTHGDQTAVVARSAPGFIHKVSHRLPPEVLQQLVTDYEAGASTRQLMQLYGLGKGTVLRILERAGTEVRQQGLRPADQHEAARLYASGWSAVRVADKLGCSPDSVIAYARAAGVSIRPRQGGRQPKPS